MEPTPAVAVPVRRPRGGLLRTPDFRRLWTAETISQFGTQVSLLAIPLVAIVLLDATPFEVALLGTVEMLPFILLSLPAGAWVDRLRRRPILIAGDLGRAALLVSVPLAALLDVLTIWQLYAVGFLAGTLTVFFDVAYQSYLPSIVEREEILEGNAKLEVSRTVAQTAGPAIGGGLIELLTAPLAIAADAVSFVASALFVWRIRKPEPVPDRHVDEHGQPRGSLRSEVAAGLRYVLGNRYLRSIAACTSIGNFGGNMLFATLLVYLVRELEMQPGLIGLVFGIGNVGAIAGAFTAVPIGRRLGVGPTIIGAAILGALAAFLIPLAPKAVPAPFLVAAGALTGFSNVVYNVSQVSFRQAITPSRMQGRMNATMRFIVWGTIPLGQVIGGVLATTMGLVAPLWIGATVGTLAVLPVLLGPVRGLREMPAPVSGEPAGPPSLTEAIVDAAERETGPLGLPGAPMPAPVEVDEPRER